METGKEGGQKTKRKKPHVFKGLKGRTPGGFGAHSSPLHHAELSSNRLVGVEEGGPRQKERRPQAGPRVASRVPALPLT